MGTSLFLQVIRTLCVILTCAEGAYGGTFASLGCYAESSATIHDLSGPKESIPSDTGSQCASWCQAGGYPYAGLQLVDYCYCGTSFGNSGSSSNCNTSCSDGSSCGGVDANSVYYTLDSDLNSQRGLVIQGDKEQYVKARMACVIYGGDLATIESTTAINNIISAIPANVTSISSLWVGLRRRLVPGGPFEWTNENLSPSYNSHVADFAGFWVPGETFSNDCVSLSVATKLLQTTSCTTTLPYVCFQLPTQNGITDASITSAPSTDLSADSKKLALFIVLPLFLFCYGGACVLYCVHKILKNCRGKKMTKMSLDEVQPNCNPPLGAREKQPMPYTDNPPMAYPQKAPTRPPSGGKRGMVYPAPMAMAPVYMQHGGEMRTKTPVQEFKIIDEEDERPSTTPREINLLAQSPPPTYADKQEEKRARLLENAAREARERRQKEAEAEGRPLSTKSASRPVTAQHPEQPAQAATPEGEPEEVGPEVTGSTTNLLSKADDSPRDDEENPAGMSIGDILKMKMAQKADKKKPRKVIAS